MKVKILLVGFVMVFAASSAHAISIVASPSNISVPNVGELFSVKVLLTDHIKTNDIFAADFRMTYNPEYAKLVDSAGIESLIVQSKIPWKGGFWGSVDTLKGIIEYSGFNMTSIDCQSSTLSDSFPITLAEFTFKALKQGKSTISFDTSVDPLEVFNSPTVVYLLSVDTSCAGAVIPTPKNSNVQIGDFDAPVLSNLTVTKATRSTATVTWTTNENANTQVQYGTTEALGLSTTIQDASPLVSSHTITISGLFPDSSYFFRAVSMDAAQNVGLSEIKSFKTNQVDETPPVITHEEVKYATESIQQEILAGVIDDNKQAIPQVALYYKKSSETQFSQVTMAAKDATTFSAFIPKESVVNGDNVNYYIEASDNFLNKSTSPAGAPVSVHTISVSNKFSVKSINGYVYSDSAKTKAIPGVKVRVIGLGVFAETNDEGRYQLDELPIPGTDPSYTLEASKEGFLTDTEVYTFQFDISVDFVLTKSGILSGTVYNSNTCQPLQLMKLTLKDAAGNAVEAFTDETGTYKISNFKIDTYDIIFSKVGFNSVPAKTAGCDRPLPSCTSSTITFTENALEQDQTCHFLADPKPVSLITITPANVFVAPGDTVQFKVSLATDDGENVLNIVKNQTISWTTSTTSLGNLTETGLFTAGIQNISGFVQAQAGSATATANVSVRRDLTFRSVTNEIKAFNPRKLANGIEIRYELTQDPSIVVVSIYTMTGRKIRTITGQDGTDPSTGVALWDGKDEFGNEVYNGIYVYQIMAQNNNGTVYSRPKALGILK